MVVMVVVSHPIWKGAMRRVGRRKEEGREHWAVSWPQKTRLSGTVRKSRDRQRMGCIDFGRRGELFNTKGTKSGDCEADSLSSRRSHTGRN